MGMSTHIIGFRPPDDKFRRMRDAYDACVGASVQIPEEVADFFEDEPPDIRGVAVGVKEATKEYRDDRREGIEVDLNRLPEHVTVLRFYNSW